MLWVPPAPEFLWIVSNHTTRPADAMGTAITPAQNAYGSYTSILAGGSITNDICALQIVFNSGRVSGTARDMLITIGMDPAGGTSYSTLIPDLLGSCAAAMTLHGYGYYFPILVPSGAQLAAKASVNNSNLATVSVWIQGYGHPRYPEAVRVGRSVTAYGITAASSSGTAITSGTTSEGSWTQLTASTSKDHWFWQLGMGCGDATMSTLVYHTDLAAGASSDKLLINEQPFFANTSEDMGTFPEVSRLSGHVPSGTKISQRIQCSGTADSSLSGAAYGVT